MQPIPIGPRSVRSQQDPSTPTIRRTANCTAASPSSFPSREKEGVRSQDRLACASVSKRAAGGSNRRDADREKALQKNKQPGNVPRKRLFELAFYHAFALEIVFRLPGI